LFEGHAFHAKWLILLISIMINQVEFYFLAAIFYIFIFPGTYYALHLSNGVRSMRALAKRMQTHTPTPWIKVKPYSRDELITKFGLIQYSAPHNRTWDLFLIKKEGSAELNHYCYINTLSNVYIESVNADMEVKNLPAAQRFMIYHEIAHASFLGSEYWIALRAEVFFVPITLFFLLLFVAHDASVFLFAPVFMLAIAMLSQATRRYRNITSEQVADRLALRWIYQEDQKTAVRIGKIKVRRWRDFLESGNISPASYFLYLNRTRNIEFLLKQIRNSQKGKLALDIDRFPWPVRLPFHFLFALASLSLFMIWGNPPSPEQTLTLFWLTGIGTLVLIVVGSFNKHRLERLEAYVQSHFKE
ncbi:MAG: hypothetical protein AAGA50_30010, partial [Pseudomonadota bacterium]